MTERPPLTTPSQMTLRRPVSARTLMWKHPSPWQRRAKQPITRLDGCRCYKTTRWLAMVSTWRMSTTFRPLSPYLSRAHPTSTTLDSVPSVETKSLVLYSLLWLCLVWLVWCCNNQNIDFNYGFMLTLTFICLFYILHSTFTAYNIAFSRILIH